MLRDWADSWHPLFSGWNERNYRAWEAHDSSRPSVEKWFKRRESGSRREGGNQRDFSCIGCNHPWSIDNSRMQRVQLCYVQKHVYIDCDSKLKWPESSCNIILIFGYSLQWHIRSDGESRWVSTPPTKRVLHTLTGSVVSGRWGTLEKLWQFWRKNWRKRRERRQSSQGKG